jgi:hypothetical protein
LAPTEILARLLMHVTQRRQLLGEEAAPDGRGLFLLCVPGALAFLVLLR